MMDTPIKNYINKIEIDRWIETGTGSDRVRSLYCGDGEGDFEKRSYYTTVECLEDYMVQCEEQKIQAYEDLKKLMDRQSK